jgi:hypothetical protein
LVGYISGHLRKSHGGCLLGMNSSSNARANAVTAMVQRCGRAPHGGADGRSALLIPKGNTLA